MYTTFFKEIAKKENGKFYLHDKNISIGGGVRSPNIIYKLKFSYNNNNFIITYQVGNTNVGTIHCELSKSLKPIEFEINSISHLKNLFLRKKNRLKVKTSDENFSCFINNNHSFEALNQIASKENFSPYIYSKLNNSWSIISEYHLEFSDWTQTVEPSIDFIKNIIDQYQK